MGQPPTPRGVLSAAPWVLLALMLEAGFVAAQVPEPSPTAIPQLAQATAHAPAWVTEWYEELQQTDPSLVGVSLQPNPEDNYLYIQATITPNELYRINFNYPGLVAGRSTYYGLSWMTR